MIEINEWLSISEISGSGDKEITISANSSKELEERIKSLKIKADEISAFVNITQKAFVPIFTLSESTLRYTQDILLRTTTVTSNIPWTAVVKDDWITLSQTNGEEGITELEITVNSINSPIYNRNGIIDFYHGERLIGTLIINQEFNIIFKVDTISLNMTETRNSVIKVTSNTEWECEVEGEGNYWVSVKPSSGKGDTDVTVSANEFTGLDRETKINFLINSKTVVSVRIYQMLLKEDQFYIEPLNEGETITIGLRYYTEDSVEYLVEDEYKWDSISYTDYNITTDKRVYFKNLTFDNSGDELISSPFKVSGGSFRIGGNIETLLGSMKMTSYYGYYAYCLFRNLTNLVDASTLILPAEKLAEDCYYAMFEGCSNLINAPELPATTLNVGCYLRMFKDCTSLTTAPELPSLYLSPYCYEWMFYGCANLNYIKMMAVSSSEDNMKSWVKGVAPTGTFVKHPANIMIVGEDAIPIGWVVEDAFEYYAYILNGDMDMTTELTSTLYIYSNTAWTLTTEADWIHLSNNSGNGNQTVEITVDNFMFDDRDADVCLYVNGEKKASINVFQIYIDENIKIPTEIYFTTDLFKTINVPTSRYEVKTETSWIKIKSNRRDFLVEVEPYWDENHFKYEPRYGEISIYVNNVEHTIKVYQSMFNEELFYVEPLYENCIEPIKVYSARFANWIYTDGDRKNTCYFLDENVWTTSTVNSSKRIYIYYKERWAQYSYIDGCLEGYRLVIQGNSPVSIGGKYGIPEEKKWLFVSDVGTKYTNHRYMNVSKLDYNEVMFDNCDNVDYSETYPNIMIVENNGININTINVSDKPYNAAYVFSNSDWVSETNSDWLTLDNYNGVNGTLIKINTSYDENNKIGEINFYIKGNLEVVLTIDNTNKKDYFYIEPIDEDCKLRLAYNEYVPAYIQSDDIYYFDEEIHDWVNVGFQINPAGNIKSIPITKKTYFKDYDRSSYVESNLFITSYLRITGKCNIGGNIETLLGKIKTTYKNDFFARYLFYKSDIVDASNLILPSLELIPNCYDSMFYGCQYLSKAPELPAITLVSNCYNSMFYNCSNLNNITMLATDISAYNCLKKWTYGVSSSGNFVKKQGIEIPSGVNGIPNGWTVVEV